MADVHIREAVLEDVDLLVANLRPADVREIAAYGYEDPAAPLRASVSTSLHCWSAFVDGELACIMGVTPLSMLSGIGSPWMMGTPLLEKHARVLVRLTPGYIRRMLKAFPILTNHVHAENVTSVRWLRRLGFALSRPLPYGPTGALFHTFEMRA